MNLSKAEIIIRIPSEKGGIEKLLYCIPQKIEVSCSEYSRPIYRIGSKEPAFFTYGDKPQTTYMIECTLLREDLNISESKKELEIIKTMLKEDKRQLNLPGIGK